MFKIKIKETTWNRVDAFGDHVRCKQRLCLRSEIISSSPCPFCCRFQTTYIFDDNLKKYIHCYHIIILWLYIIICHILILQRLVGLDNLTVFIYHSSHHLLVQLIVLVWLIILTMDVWFIHHPHFFILLICSSSRHYSKTIYANTLIWLNKLII